MYTPGLWKAKEDGTVGTTKTEQGDFANVGVPYLVGHVRHAGAVGQTVSVDSKNLVFAVPAAAWAAITEAVKE